MKPVSLPLSKISESAALTIGTGSSPASILLRLATISLGLQLNILVLHPVPIPSLPLTSTMGMMGQYHSGSTRWLSSKRVVSNGSSLAGNRSRAKVLEVKIEDVNRLLAKRLVYHRISKPNESLVHYVLVHGLSPGEVVFFFFFNLPGLTKQNALSFA